MEVTDSEEWRYSNTSTRIRAALMTELHEKQTSFEIYKILLTTQQNPYSQFHFLFISTFISNKYSSKQTSIVFSLTCNKKKTDN